MKGWIEGNERAAGSGAAAKQRDVSFEIVSFYDRVNLQQRLWPYGINYNCSKEARSCTFDLRVKHRSASVRTLPPASSTTFMVSWPHAWFYGTTLTQGSVLCPGTLKVTIWGWGKSWLWVVKVQFGSKQALVLPWGDSLPSVSKLTMLQLVWLHGHKYTAPPSTMSGWLVLALGAPIKILKLSRKEEIIGGLQLTASYFG